MSIQVVMSSRFKVDHSATDVDAQKDEEKDDTSVQEVKMSLNSDTSSTPSAASEDEIARELTIEHPPNIDFYRNTKDRPRMSTRPSIHDLLHEGVFEQRQPPARDEKESAFDVVSRKISRSLSSMKSFRASNDGERKKFGWIEGVFVRCLQNIIGVILFIRLAWVASQAGAVLGVLIILLATLVTTITTISTSAICTNGEIQGGGAYYLISRTLGPEIGGSIGLIFSAANAVGGALYIVGFAETVRDILYEYDISMLDPLNDIRIISTVTCCILMTIIVVGVSFESKLQQIMLIPLIACVISYVGGSFLPPSHDKAVRGYTGYSWTTFSDNLVPSFRDGESFFTVFAVFFPAATGIMAGANISGDLKNPQKAIPRGTLLAIFVSSLIYIGTLLLCAATFVRDADGETAVRLIEGSVSYLLPDCVFNSTSACKYGLANNNQILTTISLWGPLISLGIFASTICSALASLVSTPKIFQAVCKDELFPYITYFAKEGGKNGDPRRAYVLSFVVTLAVIMIGEVNAIAPIISNFFLCGYAIVNFACFSASFSDSPGFRPAFRFYNMWVSLLGAVLCVLIMFIMNWITALVTFAAFATIYMIVKKINPDVNWGSSTQANLYKSTLSGLNKLQKTEDHVKNYRPQMLVLSGPPHLRPGLIDFAGSVTRGSALLVCGSVETAHPSHHLFSSLRQADERAVWFMRKRGVKAFAKTVVAPSLEEGANLLMQGIGVGKLQPNIVLIGWKSDWAEDAEKTKNYFRLIQSAFEQNLSLAILRQYDGFDMTEVREKRDKRQGGRPRVYSASRPTVEKRRHSVVDFIRSIQSKRNRGVSESEPEAKTAREMQTVEEGTAMEQQEQTEQTKQTENKKNIKTISGSLALYADGPPGVAEGTTKSSFSEKVKKGVIDVWWLADDGGLTMLLPHLLTLSRSYLEGATLRVFTTSSTPSTLDNERQQMAALMAKFRISYADLSMVPDMDKQPEEKTKRTFDELIGPYRAEIGEAELRAMRGKTNRHLRTAELLQAHSVASDLVVITLPVPRPSHSARLYLSWIDMLSRRMPPCLLVRGNHTSVLTFYS